MRDPYIAGFAAALHPVFLVAAGFTVAALAIAWLLPEEPLREHAMRDARRPRSRRGTCAVAVGAGVGDPPVAWNL